VVENLACAEPVALVSIMTDRPAPSIEAVFQEHGRFVYRALRYLGVGDADLEDVCQDVFIIIHKKLAEFEARSTLKTWIYGICVRAAADYRKSVRRRRDSPTNPLPECACPPNQLGDLERASARELLRALLDGLDEEKRDVLVLYEIEGLGMKEVALALGIPLQTAYWRLHAGRSALAAAARRIRARGAA
jgi:RNA polymerase sigma-70 factor (ECF subfamily)